MGGEKIANENVRWKLIGQGSQRIMQHIRQVCREVHYGSWELELVDVAKADTMDQLRRTRNELMDYNLTYDFIERHLMILKKCKSEEIIENVMNVHRELFPVDCSYQYGNKGCCQSCKLPRKVLNRLREIAED